jgi:hypothetical protein
MRILNLIMITYQHDCKGKSYTETPLKAKPIKTRRQWRLFSIDAS